MWVWSLIGCLGSHIHLDLLGALGNHLSSPSLSLLSHKMGVLVPILHTQGILLGPEPTNTPLHFPGNLSA